MMTFKAGQNCICQGCVSCHASTQSLNFFGEFYMGSQIGVSSSSSLLSAGVLNNSWKVRVQTTFAFTWLVVNMRTTPFLLRKITQKSELENRHGSARQLTAQKTLCRFSGRVHVEEKSHPSSSLSHGYLPSVQCCGMLYSASPLVSHWSLALPSFEPNTNFLVFTIWLYLQHLDFVAASTNCLVTRVCSWTENCLSWNHHCKTTCH